MNKSIIKYLVGFILLGFLSCSDKTGSQLPENPNDRSSEQVTQINSKSTLSLKEFVTWCSNPENNLNKIKEVSELKYSLVYMPIETMAFLELRNQTYDRSKFEKTCDHYSEMTYFNLKIELPEGNGELIKHNLKTAAQYEERIRYTSFDMQNDIYLVQGSDTLKPGLYQTERIFEVAPFMVASFGFDNKKFDKTKQLSIVFNDRLFDKGFIKYIYNNGQLIDLPTIKEL